MNHPHQPSRRRVGPGLSAATAAALALALAASGCSSTGGRKAQQAANGAGGCSSTTMTVTMVTHSGPGDDFWDLVRKGAEDAARKDCINLQYQASPDGATQASYVQAAVDKHVDGIAVTLAKPSQMAAAVKDANAAGIPVTALNAGATAWQRMGVKGFFGQDDEYAGEQAGHKLQGLGARNVLCVQHEQGNVGNEARCAGIKKVMPSTQILYVDGTSPSDIQSKITGKLQQDHSIDTIMGLKAAVGLIAVTSAKEAGSTAKVATFDTNAQLVAAIKAGTIEFAVDQQPYLQGYLAVDSLWLYKTNGDTIGGGSNVLTGPAFVDRSNVAQIATYAAAGKR